MATRSGLDVRLGDVAEKFVRTLVFQKEMIMTGEQYTSCRSEEGITVGLIDALISIARILVVRDFTPSVVKEALLDLASDEDVAKVLSVVKG